MVANAEKFGCQIGVKLDGPIASAFCSLCLQEAHASGQPTPDAKREAARNSLKQQCDYLSSLPDNNIQK